MKLLIAGSLELKEQYRKKLEDMGYEIIVSPREDSELGEYIRDIDAVICNWLFVNHDINGFTNLKCIQLLSAGLDRVPLEYIRLKGIKLYNAKGVYSIPMAEFALSGVLALFKKSFTFFENQKSCKWEKERSIRELNGSQVCIVGAGNVGQETAKRFSAFTDNIIGIDLFPCNQPYFNDVLPLENLDAVLAESDVVILTLPLTEKTKGMFGKDKINCIKKDAVIVNIARGGIIDEKALKEALSSRLYGAVLDVFAEEPLPESNSLWKMKNVIITPHNSFVSDKNNERMWNVILHNLKEFIDERNSDNE